VPNLRGVPACHERTKKRLSPPAAGGATGAETASAATLQPGTPLQQTEEVPGGASSGPSAADGGAQARAAAAAAEVLGSPELSSLSGSPSLPPASEPAPPAGTPQGGNAEEQAHAPEVAVAPTAPSATPPGSSPQARDIAITRTTVDLVKFVSFTDFVTCDYNQDGHLDVLALNSRISNGCGATGIGNGLFTEGPSFDLPFRPAGAVSLGSGPETQNGIFLVGSEGTVSLFFPLIVNVSQAIAPAATFAVFRVDTPTGPLFVVCETGKSQVHLYGAEDLTVKDLGTRSSARAASAADWCKKLAAWQLVSEGKAFPLPPEGADRTTCVADVNGDSVPDLVYYESGQIVWKLSKDGMPLALEKSSPCPAKPTVIRIADVDGNGLGDALALMGTSGVLGVYLTMPE